MFRRIIPRLLLLLIVASLALLVVCDIANASLYISTLGDTVRVYDPDTKTMDVVKGFTHSGCLALSPDGSKLYVGDSGEIKIVSTASNEVIGSIPFNHPISQLVVSGDSKLYVVSKPTQNALNIYIYDAQNYNYITEHDLPYNGYIALSPDGSRIYIAGTFIEDIDHPGGNIFVYDTGTWTPQTHRGGSFIVQALALNPSGTTLYIRVDQSDGPRLAAFRTSDMTVINSVAVPRDIRFLAVKPNEKYVYTSNYGDTSVSAIKADASSVKTTVATPVKPRDLAFGAIDGSERLFISCDNKQIAVLNPSDYSLDSFNIDFEATYLAWKGPGQVTMTNEVSMTPAIALVGTPTPAPTQAGVHDKLTYLVSTPDPTPSSLRMTYDPATQTPEAATPTETAASQTKPAEGQVTPVATTEVKPSDAPASQSKEAASTMPAVDIGKSTPTATPGKPGQSIYCLGVPVIGMGAILALGPLARRFRK